MGAYICIKPAGSCNTCEHYRYDEDYGSKVCFAEQDLKRDSWNDLHDNAPHLRDISPEYWEE